MAEAMRPPAGAIAPSPSALEKLRAAMDDSQAAVDRLSPEVKEQARKEAESSLDPEGYGQGAMGLKAFGDPGGMPAPAVPPKQDPYKPMEKAEPEDIALRAAEVGSFVDPTPASDAVAAKIYWDKGDKEAAAWTLGLSLGGLGAGAALTRLLKWRNAWKAERALDDVPMEQATDEANELTTYAVRQMRERYEKLAQGGADIKAGRFRDQGPLDENDRRLLEHSLKHQSGRNIDEFSDAELRRIRDIGAASGFEELQKVPGGYGPEDLDPRSGNTPSFGKPDGSVDPTYGPYHKLHQSSPGFDKNWFEDEIAKMGKMGPQHPNQKEFDQVMEAIDKENAKKLSFGQAIEQQTNLDFDSLSTDELDDLWLSFIRGEDLKRVGDGIKQSKGTPVARRTLSEDELRLGDYWANQAIRKQVRLEDIYTNDMSRFAYQALKKQQKMLGLSDEAVLEAAELPEDALAWLFKILEPVEEAAEKAATEKIGPLW